MLTIHPTAVVSPKANLAEDVVVGPYAVIDGSVTIGAGTNIGPAVHIFNSVTIGAGCKIYSGAVIGNPPQDLKYNGEPTTVTIGENNVIREYVTINLATGEGNATVIGNNNLLMAYVHIAHNCVVGDNCIIANAATVAGHVVIEDYAIIGGLVGIHQFSRVGKHSITGGCSKITMDIVPFVSADGHPARPYGINTIGLKRRNIPQETIETLERAYRVLFRGKLNTSGALAILEGPEFCHCPEVKEIVRFVKTAERGIARERD